MQAQPLSQGLGVEWPGRQCGEEPQFHGAQQGLGAQEGETQIQDPLRPNLIVHGPPLLHRVSASIVVERRHLPTKVH